MDNPCTVGGGGGRAEKARGGQDGARGARGCLTPYLNPKTRNPKPETRKMRLLNPILKPPKQEEEEAEQSRREAVRTTRGEHAAASRYLERIAHRSSNLRIPKYTR